MKHAKGSAAVLLICGALLTCALFAPEASASVTTTREAAGAADSIYVAGNPDWYPIEYYDADSECYEGVMPALLERISEETGLHFTYIQAGREDQRLRLAQNGQVEIVSGFRKNTAELEKYGVTNSEILFTLDGEKGAEEVCFAFTAIADEALISTFEQALESVSGEELAGMAVLFSQEQEKECWPTWVKLLLIGIILVLALCVFVLARQRHKDKIAMDQDDMTDPLTGLGNKIYFKKCFEKDLSDQYRGMYGLVYIGFDAEHVYKTAGEAALENLTCFAANELMNSREADMTVARIGRGSFAVLRLCSGENEAAAWTGELLEKLNKRSADSQDNRAEFFAGIYLLKQNDFDCEMALFNAQQGYQHALSKGERVAVSDKRLLNTVSEKQQLRKQMLQAIEKHEFQMYLQFIVSAESGEIVEAESLSRWMHPQKGLLFPGSYISLLESEKVVEELDFYIFEEACKQLEKWQKQGLCAGISCNFTRITIDHADFIARLELILQKYFFDHEQLIIEITEDIMEVHKELAFENISRCKELGFRIALDDAGSGYTSFSDLRDYPIDIVKIDRSILTAAVTEKGIALLRGMIALVHSMKMKALCEGIETEQQYRLLRDLGCDYLQGYYFFRALPKEEADRVLRSRAEAVRGS